MEEPDADLRAGPDEQADAPDFDALVAPGDLVRGERTRDDFLDAVLGLDEPATIEEVAALADHGRDAAREYLEWFDRMGIVRRVGESPATYRLNREYLVWRRVQRIREEYDPEQLVEYLDAETERDREFATEFDAERPEQVRLSEYARTTGTSVEAAWRQLSAWRTTRRRISILERALARTDESPAGQQSHAA